MMFEDKMNEMDDGMQKKLLVMKIGENIVNMLNEKKAERLQKEEERKQERINRRKLRQQRIFAVPPKHMNRQGIASRWDQMQEEGKIAR